MNATRLWTLWQAILAPYAACFTRPGFHRFVEWLTGLALNVEEHTITQSLVGLERTDDWKALEAFAEYGAWDRDAVERVTAQLLEDAPGRFWHGFHVWAGDDTKVHRTSKDVWGTNTFHEYTARCPNRASHGARPQLGRRRRLAAQPRAAGLVRAGGGSRLNWTHPSSGQNLCSMLG